MPTYSYECKDCAHTYDAFQSMKDEPDTVCPSCGGRVERLIGAGAGIVFKGSGFYVTDYKKSSSASSSTGANASAKSEKGNGSSDSGTSAKSSDSSSSSSSSSTSASSGNSSTSTTTGNSGT